MCEPHNVGSVVITRAGSWLEVDYPHRYEPDRYHVNVKTGVITCHRQACGRQQFAEIDFTVHIKRHAGACLPACEQFVFEGDP